MFNYLNICMLFDILLWLFDDILVLFRSWKIGKCTMWGRRTCIWWWSWRSCSCWYVMLTLANVSVSVHINYHLLEDPIPNEVHYCYKHNPKRSCPPHPPPLLPWTVVARFHKTNGNKIDNATTVKHMKFCTFYELLGTNVYMTGVLFSSSQVFCVFCMVFSEISGCQVTVHIFPSWLPCDGLATPKTLVTSVSDINWSYFHEPPPPIFPTWIENELGMHLWL